MLFRSTLGVVGQRVHMAKQFTLESPSVIYKEKGWYIPAMYRLLSAKESDDKEQVPATTNRRYV